MLHTVLFPSLSLLPLACHITTSFVQLCFNVHTCKTFHKVSYVANSRMTLVKQTV